VSNTDSGHFYDFISKSVLFEDNHIIVINKQPGQIVQGDKTGDKPLSELVKLYIAKKYNKPGEVFLGVAHRLDRPVSGAVIFARTSKALTRLNLMLKNHEIRKTYWAVTVHKPPKEADTLIHELVRNAKQNKSYAVKEATPDSQRAELQYEFIAHTERYFLLEIELKTGRHHQIRSQLAAIGCPIKGDLKYGAPRSNPDGSIHLHARKVEFIHPVSKQPLVIIAPQPSDAIWEAIMRNF